MYTDFIDKSNARARQMARAKELSKESDYENKICQGIHHVGRKDPMTEAQITYSTTKFNKRLCWYCQGKETVSTR